MNQAEKLKRHSENLEYMSTYDLGKYSLLLREMLKLAFNRNNSLQTTRPLIKYLNPAGSGKVKCLLLHCIAKRSMAEVISEKPE